MSSSEDDIPLARGTKNGLNGKRSSSNAMDIDSSPGAPLQPGISVRMGPMEMTNGNSPQVNGQTNGKRKSRGSINQSYKESSSDSDDAPLSKRPKTTAMNGTSDDDSDVPLAHNKGSAKKPPKITAAQVGEKESKVPIEKRLAKQKGEIEKKAEKVAKKIRAEDKNASKNRKAKQDSDSDDDVPIAKARTSTSASKSKKPKAEPASAKKTKSKVKAKSEEVEEEEDGEEEYKWWENLDKNDGSVKWETLEHSGVIFPPDYEPLPKKVKLIYDGTPVTLAPEAEEVAGFYGAMLNSEVNVGNPTFNANFFDDFKKIVQKTGGATGPDGQAIKITSFEKCNFQKIFEYYVAERDKKKALSSAEKKVIKAKKDADEEKYLHCLWDGRKQKVGNFRVEPPGLFRGRGDHPKTGRVKKRVKPEQITINIGKKAKVPLPPAGHRWKEVSHDNKVTWLAMWQENINNNYKYVMLAANSDVKGMSDYKKFEKARELKKHIDKIRRDYTKELKSKVMADRQRATAIYLIDKLALRAGNEKGDDEAETVGCCSLKFEHITLRPPNTVIFDFLGKDSIRYYDEVEVDEQVFKNLKIFKKEPKGKGDDIFDRLNTSVLNKHLSSYMQGLTAKVFRTYNASWTMASLLKDLKVQGTIPEKMKQYNDANRKVAILCNHKRTVGAAHETQMGKLQDRINGLRYQQYRIRLQMLDLDSKLKKKRGAEYFARPDDMTDEWVESHIAAEVEEKRQKITKKWEKENEKLVAEGKKPQPEKELKERLSEATDLEKKYKKEQKTGKVEAEGKGPSVDKLEANYEKLTQRIEAMKLQAEDKEDNKEIALGTSKINYIDPRLSVVFSKKFDVPIERLFSKTLREKFDWAIRSVEEDWDF